MTISVTQQHNVKTISTHPGAMPSTLAKLGVRRRSLTALERQGLVRELGGRVWVDACAAAGKLPKPRRNTSATQKHYLHMVQKVRGLTVVELAMRCMALSKQGAPGVRRSLRRLIARGMLVEDNRGFLHVA